jgi:hypothetical protein
MREEPQPRDQAVHPRALLRDTAAHEDAVVQAEARRLLHALAPFGILSREALELECGAWTWHDGGFTSALRAVISAGLVVELPGGFYRDARNRQL